MSAVELEKINQMLMANRADPNATVEESRRATEAAGAAFPVPAGVVPGEGAVGGVPGLWLDAPVASDQRVVLYMHGGAYVIGSARSFARLAAEVAIAAGVCCFSLDYRLAPEHPFPAAVDDAMAAYNGLLQRGFQPAQVAFAGDSAGGGLTIATLLACRDHGLAMPACAVVLSPWLDLTLTGDSMQRCVDSDLVLTAPRLAARAKLYLGSTSNRHPLASPLFGDLTGLPPLLMHASSAELLCDDAVRFAARAAAAGVRVTLDIWPGMPHDWHRFTPMLSEAREGVAAAGRFLAAQLA